MQRQIDSDPSSIQKGKEETKTPLEGVVSANQSVLEGGGDEGTEKKKRRGVDKQQAFIEYKQEGDGRNLEKAIIESRNDTKNKRNTIKTLTQIINSTKLEMDKVKERLDYKQDEKKAQMREDFNSDAFGDDDNTRGIEEIIDEEELMLLKEMKDLKKNYRENYDKLKNLKVDINDLQTNIDNMKQ